MAVTATETGIVQGETKFATWMADLLGGASTRVARTAVDTIEPVGFTSQRLSADSERWLSPSGHAQLRPSGDVPLGTAVEDSSLAIERLPGLLHWLFADEAVAAIAPSANP